MDDGQRVLIGTEDDDHVLIARSGHRSKDWVAADAEVRCDVWTGRVRCAFHWGELSHFADEIRRLHQRLTGAAELETREPNIRLEFVGDGKGHVTVDGEARGDFASGAMLKFRIKIDQTFLKRIADELDAMEKGTQVNE